MTAAAIVRAGLIDRNPALVQLLGVCPLLAASTSLVNGLGLGLATLLVICASSLVVPLVARRLLPEVRLIVFVVIIATAVTAVELAMSACFPGLRASLGIFVPLIASNCLVLSRADTFAAHHPLPKALLDGLGMGCGFLLVLVALGSIRELLGHGTLGAGLDLLFGASASTLAIELLPSGTGLALALLPPGAFLLLGLLVALRNSIGGRSRTIAAAGDEPVEA